MTSAPATPPAVPSAVIPPEAPRVTRAPVVIRRGANGEKAPSSVAQVSAAAAASAPAVTDQAPHSAASAATPPFAMTCRVVRRGARRSASWVRRLPDRKKANSRTRPCQPRPQATAAPTASAAARPPGVSQLTRRTARAGCGASNRAAHPAPGSGPAGTSGTAARSRTPHRRAGTRRGARGSPAPPAASARGRDTHTGARSIRGSSCGTSLDVAHADGVLVQLPLEQAPGAEQSGFHGADGHVEHAGDLLVRQALHVAQHHGLPELFRQLVGRSEHL